MSAAISKMRTSDLFQLAKQKTIGENENSSETKQAKISDYTLGNQLGQGAYAVVKSGFNKLTGKKVAVKIYEKYRIADPQRKTSVNREIKLLQRLQHDNIVKLYDTIDTQKQLFLIMELARGRSLCNFVRGKQNRRLTEVEAVKIFKQILSAVDYLHKQNITHRDIKMENILVDDQLSAKLIDFGFSICAPPTQKLKIFCGTPSYMAPEIVNRKEYIGPPTDIWSLGVMFYVMLAGCFPFRGISDHELFRNISKGTVAYPSGISADAKTAIAKMLKVDPNLRATATEVNFFYYYELNRF